MLWRNFTPSCKEKTLSHCYPVWEADEVQTLVPSTCLKRQPSSSLDSTLKMCQMFKTEHTACWKEHHSSSLHCSFPLRVEGGSSLQTAHECSPTPTVEGLPLTAHWRSCSRLVAELWNASRFFKSWASTWKTHSSSPSLDKNYSITCTQQGLNHSHTDTPRDGHVAALSKQSITLNRRAAPCATAPLQGQQELVNMSCREPAMSKVFPAIERPQMINKHTKRVKRLVPH